MSESADGADFGASVSKTRRAPGVNIDDATVELDAPGGSLQVRTYRAAEGKALPVVLFFPDERSGKKSGEWISSWLALAVRGLVLEVRPRAGFSASAILDWAGRHAAKVGGSSERLAVLGNGGGADSALAAFSPLASGLTPSVAPTRLVMISPTATAWSNGVPAGLPTVLLQVSRPKTGRHPSVAVLEQLKDAGSPARIIEYLGKDRDWAASPRSERSAPDRLLDTITFLRRGLVDDSYAIVPNWNMH